ncbi:MAG: RDD family protein [Solirubrobacteraceae bacterium]|nr:RDD family protein [Solirubrobacteraceae bacterium]
MALDLSDLAPAPAATAQAATPLQPAGHLRRLAAAMIDFSICFGFVAGLAYLLQLDAANTATGFTLIQDVRSPAVSDAEARSFARVWIFVTVVGVLYASSASRLKPDRFSGQTVGKHLLRIRIVAADGSPVDPDIVTGRAALMWVLLAGTSAIPLLMPGGAGAVILGSALDTTTTAVLLIAWLAIYADQRQRSLFDRLFGTAVVAAHPDDFQIVAPGPGIAPQPMTAPSVAGLAASALVAIGLLGLNISWLIVTVPEAQVHWDAKQQKPIEDAAAVEQALLECLNLFSDPERCTGEGVAGVTFAELKARELLVSPRAKRHVGRVAVFADKRELVVYSYAPDNRIWFSDVSTGQPARACLTYTDAYCDGVEGW